MTFADFDQWLCSYGEAWMARDPDAAVMLFSPDVEYHETPFGPAAIGASGLHQYWTEGAVQNQRDVKFEGTPITLENDRGLAHWRASFRRTGTHITVELDGVLSAAFDGSGRCVEFREWWHRREQPSCGDWPTTTDEPMSQPRYVDSTRQLVVELSIQNLRRSLDFYQRLGFHIQRAEAKFAVVAWEDHQLFLAEDGTMLKALDQPYINVRVMVPDVDHLWQRVQDLGLAVLVPIGDRSYGLRDFTLADPDGFGVRFATWLHKS